MDTEDVDGRLIVKIAKSPEFVKLDKDPLQGQKLKRKFYKKN